MSKIRNRRENRHKKSFSQKNCKKEIHSSVQKNKIENLCEFQNKKIHKMKFNIYTLNHKNEIIFFSFFTFFE